MWSFKFTFSSVESIVGNERKKGYKFFAEGYVHDVAGNCTRFLSSQVRIPSCYPVV